MSGREGVGNAKGRGGMDKVVRGEGGEVYLKGTVHEVFKTYRLH